MLALGRSEMTATTSPLLVVEDLVVQRGHAGGWLPGSTGDLLRVVDGVSFEVRSGETFGIVGESGCGKTTLALALLRLLPTHSGRVRFDGTDVLGLTEKELRAFRRQVQVVFQDPYSSLHPRKTIEKILAEPLEIHTEMSTNERRKEVRQLLEHVGLNEQFAKRTARECSGGQRQRVAIARALALRPKLILLDEPVSALDVSIRAQIMELLSRLQQELGLTYVFISHDLALVRSFCHSMAVMYLGELVEYGATSAVLDMPAHPYTRSLLQAVSIPDPDVERRRSRSEIRGEIASAGDPPSGCRFHPRCLHAQAICVESKPKLEKAGVASSSRCHFWPMVQALPPEIPRSDQSEVRPISNGGS
jgi:oligopeptide/dipeptide ABC transporter ATP-binding protein